MKQFSLIFFICFFALTGFGQSHQSDSISLKVDSLKKLLSHADTLTAEELWGDGSIDINGLIAEQLYEILTVPTIVKYNLDSLLKHDFLGITHSNDKRLWIFSWYENTGGSFKSNISFVHYRTKSNKPKIIDDYYSEEEEHHNSFCSNGAWFGQIFKLKSSTKNIYLCLGSVVGCNTCCAEIASVVELTKDSINFAYPAFSIIKQDNQNFDYEDTSPCFTLDSRCRDIEKFEYDNKTQTIFYTYMTDDNTPIVNKEKSIRVNGKLHFDGQKFIETVKEN